MICVDLILQISNSTSRIRGQGLNEAKFMLREKLSKDPLRDFALGVLVWIPEAKHINDTIRLVARERHDFESLERSSRDHPEGLLRQLHVTGSGTRSQEGNLEA